MHLNPVRAQCVERPEDYPYSSYKAYIDEHSKDDTVSRDLILKMIAEDNPEKAASRYKNCGEWKNLGLYLIKKYTPLSNKQIGQIFGNMSCSAVAKSYQRFCHRMEKNPGLVKEVVTILSNIKG